MEGLDLFQILLLLSLFLLSLSLLILLLLLPYFIAKKRNHKNKTAILVLGLVGGVLLGGIGWVVALVWSLLHQDDEQLAKERNSERAEPDSKS